MIQIHGKNCRCEEQRDAANALLDQSSEIGFPYRAGKQLPIGGTCASRMYAVMLAMAADNVRSVRNLCRLRPRWPSAGKKMPWGYPIAETSCPLTRPSLS